MIPPLPPGSSDSAPRAVSMIEWALSHVTTRTLLSYYLKTALPRRRGASDDVLTSAIETPHFAVTRSSTVDLLLWSLVKEGRDVREELHRAVDELSRHGAIQSAPDSDASTVPLSTERAAEVVHPLRELEQRVTAYVGSMEVTLSGASPTAQDSPQDREQTLPAVSNGSVRSFERRLSEELSRAGRYGGVVSVICISAHGLAAAERCGSPLTVANLIERLREAVKIALRSYDVCCQGNLGEFLLILPGVSASGCAAVVPRLRGSMDGDLAGLELAIGTATWPDHGSDGRALLAEARASLSRDLRRLQEGVVEIDSIPSSMVELHSPEHAITTTVLFEGFAHGVRVKALQTPSGGVRLQMPLHFLRVGSPVQIDVRGPTPGRTATVTQAAMGHVDGPDALPVVFLDVRLD